MKVKGQTVQAGERYKRMDGRTDGRTDRRTDGCYQVHYLPRFAVDNQILSTRHLCFKIMQLDVGK